jgi:uncharacterized protein
MPIINTTSFGLSERDLLTVSGIFMKYADVREVYIFGSRAKGSPRLASDIDLAVMNEGLSPMSLRQLKADFEDSSLPYTVDLIDYHSLQHSELKDHIMGVGALFYTRDIV